MDDIMDKGNVLSFDALHQNDNATHKEEIGPYGLFYPTQAVVSNELKKYFQTFVDVCLVSTFAYIGTIGNIINIVAFYKQGYKQTINISLTTIAVWDLIKCVCGAVHRLYGPINAVDPAFQITYNALAGVIFSYTSTSSTYVSCVLAGYVAVERCLCVSLPFTVKYLLTPKVVTAVMLLISIVVFGSFAIVYSFHQIIWMTHPSFPNETVAHVKFSTFYESNPYVFAYYNIIGFIWPCLSIMVICACTLIISYHLQKSHKFRNPDNSQSTGQSNHEVMSVRDRKVIKMLLVVIAVYIVNIIPRLILSIAKNIIPGFYIGLYYHNLFSCCMYVEFIFDFLNASINPFIYFFMSSQYKAVVKEMFAC